MIVVDDFRTLKTSEPEKCTYVIEFKDCIKIGYAKNIYDRCKKLKSKTQFKEEIFLLCTKFENYVEFQKKNLKIPRCAIFKEFEIWMDDYMQICSRRNYFFKLKFVEKVKDLLK